MEGLFGRDTELSDIGAWLDAPSELPSTLLIEGDPGIGKTSLFRAAIEMARARSFRILEAWPAESESALAYAGLVDLFRPLAGDAMPTLPEPQRAALDVALLRRPAGAAPPDRMAVSFACLGTFERLAESGPLLLAIDDAQWLDEASTEALRFALRRLGSTPVAVLCARRAGAAQSRGLGAGLPSTRPMELGPLSMGAIHAIVAEQLGTTLDRPRLRRLHELSAGNPFYALELARAVGAGTYGLGPGELLPPDLESLVGVRLAALPGPTRSVLAAAAATARPSVRLMRAVTEGDVVARLASAVDAGVVRPLAGEESSIEFAHPLLASAAYASVSPDERAGLHRALARAAADAVERAWHLAQASTPPDESVAAILETAAEEAFGRGAPSTAVDLAASARSFTPADDAASGRRRTEAEAAYRFEAGDTGGAADLLDVVIAGSTPGTERARVMARRARIVHFGEDVGAGVALLRAALAEAGPDRRLRAEIEEGLSWGLLLMRVDLPEAARHAASAARLAATSGDDAVLAEALAVKALTRLLVGRDADEPMRRALALEPATRHLRVLRHPSFAHAYVLTCRDDLVEARAVLADLRERATGRGDESAMATILLHLSMVELLSGDLPAAEQLADEAHELALESGQLPARAAALGRRALAATLRGDEAAARSAAAESLERSGGTGFNPAEPGAALARGGEIALWAIGLLEVSLGRWAEAASYLTPLADALLGAGVREPGELRFLVDEVEALLGLGQRERAAERVGLMREIADRTRRPSARAAAQLAHGLLSAADGDHAGALAALESAALLAGDVPLPLLRGRALLSIGRVQRRVKQRAAARETLELARDAFDAIGAAGWSAAATGELARIGGRVAAGVRLTATEESVARLVTRGLTNKEVASALFVTPKAIEATLARIYAKRGVRSRTELTHALGDEFADKP